MMQSITSPSKNDTFVTQHITSEDLFAKGIPYTYHALIEQIINQLFKQYSILEWEVEKRCNIRCMPMTQYKNMVDAMQIKFGTFCHDTHSLYKFNKSEVSIAKSVF